MTDDHRLSIRELDELLAERRAARERTPAGARKQVAVFGAGIAGLTAAHELVERGFEVEVYEAEPASPVEWELDVSCAVGGMARTQWARTEVPDVRGRDGCTVATEPIVWFENEEVSFAPGSADLGTHAQETLDGIRRRALALDGFEAVLVIGYARDGVEAELDARRAEAVKQYLQAGVVAVGRPEDPQGATVLAQAGGQEARRGPVGCDEHDDGPGARGAAALVELAHEVRGWHHPGLTVAVHPVRADGADDGGEAERIAARLRDVVLPVHAHRGGAGEADVATVRLVVHRQPQAFMFAAHDATPLCDPHERLRVLLADFRRRRVRSVVVRGYRAHDEVEDLAMARARAIAAGLEATAGSYQRGEIAVRPEPGGVSFEDDATYGEAERRLATVDVEEDWVPGEHGFRYFPAFYRHLFDTMERIPILEDGAAYVETPRSVIDNLVPTRDQGMNFLERPGEPSRSFVMRRRPARSLREVMQLAEKMLQAGGVTPEDTARLAVRLFQYVTSCSERRAREYEDVSWGDFIGIERFSEPFQRLFEIAPLNLVALASSKADARTFGNVTAQLLVDHLVERQRTDATLNAPTSLAWFLPWRRYLERQGVTFHHGRLDALEACAVQGPDGPELQVLAKVRLDPDETVTADGRPWRRGRPHVVLRDYLFVALSAPEAQAIVRGLCRSLEQEETAARWRPPADFARLLGLSLEHPSPGRSDGDLAHLSGIQFYFPADARWLQGHTIYMDSPWSLSSISQPQFWERQRGWWDGYRGLLSVDVSDWGADDGRGHAAWTSTKRTIAESVWRQICERIPPELRCHLPTPMLFHVDQHIEFDAPGLDGRPRRNRTPLLVNRTGVYRRRPGRLGPAGYEVFSAPVAGKVVLAGTYMQTRTRLTTMEAANESARHAVNGVLVDAGVAGFPCRVWDPEQPEDLELPDLQYFVDLDRELLRRGLPHLVDILSLQSLPDELLRGAA